MHVCRLSLCRRSQPQAGHWRGPSRSLRLSTLRPHFPFGPCFVANVKGLQLLPVLSLSCDKPRKTQAFPNTASSSPGFLFRPATTVTHGNLRQAVARPGVTTAASPRSVASRQAGQIIRDQRVVKSQTCFSVPSLLLLQHSVFTRGTQQTKGWETSGQSRVVSVIGFKNIATFFDTTAGRPKEIRRGTKRLRIETSPHPPNSRPTR